MGQIRIHHLGKAYRQYPSRWARLREWLSIGGQPRHQQRWVLQDIDLEIQPGEAATIATLAKAGGRLGARPFVPPVRDFYLTNPIARASAVMAECSALVLNGFRQAAE